MMEGTIGLVIVTSRLQLEGLGRGAGHTVDQRHSRGRASNIYLLAGGVNACNPLLVHGGFFTCRMRCSAEQRRKQFFCCEHAVQRERLTVKLRFGGYDTTRMQGNAAMLSGVQSGWAARNQYRECLENCFAEGLALL